MLLAVGIAVVSTIVGLYVSFYMNVASGAAIVLIETVLFGVALLLSPRNGFLAARRAPSAVG